MRSFIFSLIIIIFSAIYSQTICAQQRDIVLTGTVTDHQGEPLPGVTIRVRNTQFGTVTDADGRYLLRGRWEEGDIVIFSFIGMKNVRVKYVGQKVQDAAMQQDTQSLEEVVVVARPNINEMDIRAKSGVVQRVDMERLNSKPMIDMSLALQGTVPGLIVTNTGDLGSKPKIRIRGTSTINGNKAPVWVVDGVILEQDVPITASELNSEDAEYLVGNAISGISPQDIESITVLKDASATAIYGVKAANGVIVLTTKKGAVGKPKVSYHGEVVINERPSYRNFDRMNSAERMQLSKDIFEQGLSYNSNISLDPDDSYEGLLNELVNRRMSQEEFALRSQEMAKRNTDWFDVLFRNAVTHSHNLSINGGSETTKY